MSTRKSLDEQQDDPRLTEIMTRLEQVHQAYMAES